MKCVQTDKYSLADPVHSSVFDLKTEYEENSEMNGLNDLIAERVKERSDRTARCFDKRFIATEYNWV